MRWFNESSLNWTHRPECREPMRSSFIFLKEWKPFPSSSLSNICSVHNTYVSSGFDSFRLQDCLSCIIGARTNQCNVCCWQQTTPYINQNFGPHHAHALRQHSGHVNWKRRKAGVFLNFHFSPPWHSSVICLKRYKIYSNAKSNKWKL